MSGSRWMSHELVDLYGQFTSIMEQADSSVERWITEQLEWIGPDDLLHGLDLGCGLGRWTRRLNSDFCGSVTGVDSSPMMLTRASVETNSPYVHYYEASILTVTETADVVLCTYAAHHAGPARQVFSHIKSLVRPGGIAIVVDVVNPGGWETEQYHRERAERVRGLVAYRTGEREAAQVYGLLTDPTWLSMVREDVPLALSEFRTTALAVMPGALMAVLGPETAGFAWRAAKG